MKSYYDRKPAKLAEVKQGVFRYRWNMSEETVEHGEGAAEGLEDGKAGHPPEHCGEVGDVVRREEAGELRERLDGAEFRRRHVFRYEPESDKDI